MKQYEDIRIIESSRAKAEFIESAERLELALREFSMAWDKLDIYSNVDTQNELEELSKIFADSLDVATCEFAYWNEKMKIVVDKPN